MRSVLMLDKVMCDKCNASKQPQIGNVCLLDGQKQIQTACCSVTKQKFSSSVTQEFITATKHWPQLSLTGGKEKYSLT